MKILLITFDKEMENKIRQLLKDYPIVTAKNGEEALLLNLGSDVDLIIYDALAGGIAEDDINRLYDEGYKDVPYIILMDDLFPIDPSNVKPKNKKLLSREVEVDKLPQVVQELLSGKGTAAIQEEPTEETKEPTETKEVPQAAEETSWEEMFAGVSTIKPETPKEEKTEQPVEEKKEETAVVQPVTVEEVKEETKEVVSEPSIQAAETSQTSPAPTETSLRKKCLVVSFDMPLVDKIKGLLEDKCDLSVARSAKQALQKYGNGFFDVIIFDTISGVFAEKGIKDLYSRDNFKDTLYVLLLDELFPIDIEKLPVRNLRSIKRESELDLLPEIVEKAPHITFEKALFGSAEVTETTTAVGTQEEKPQEVKEETPIPVVEEKTTETEKEAEKEQPQWEALLTEQPTEGEVLKATPSEGVAKEETPKVGEVKKVPEEVVQKTAPLAAQPVPPQPAAAVQISEEQIAQIVEQKINEKVIPLIEELIKSKLSEIYIKALARELIEEQIDTATVKEIVREIAEPLVKETLESLLTE